MERLFESAWAGDLHGVMRMIELGTDVDSESYDRRTALISAAEENHVDVVRYLITQRANVEARDRDGDTALGVASSWGHYSVVECLLEHHANPDAKDELGRKAETRTTKVEIRALICRHRPRIKRERAKFILAMMNDYAPKLNVVNLVILNYMDELVGKAAQAMEDAKATSNKRKRLIWREMDGTPKKSR
uniref:Uncharacterized protein n=1 Tax=Lotharella globosa TaxID=91324 RepID=A0A6U3D315_9EUKA|mmetsp:Transcript_39442/g.76660  ORF Transcript_39442/g.76660 Transcript_39442/m.76660 type:complete len:190 (-) Transcript_39442:229-798(-)